MLVLVLDDHAVVRRGHAQILRDLLPEAETVEAESLSEALGLVRVRDEPGLIVLDLQLGDAIALESLDALRAVCPTAPILVVSVHMAGSVISAALERGANGYVAKRASEAHLRAAIQAVLAGETVTALPDTPKGDGLHLLTRRQWEVLELIHQGQSNKGIANTLDISVTTVQVHVSAILRALGVQNRTQAALLAGPLLAASAVSQPDVDAPFD